MGAFFSGLLSGAVSLVSNLFGWLKSRQDASNTATVEQAGVHAQAAEGQAVNDTPSDTDGLAAIAKKGEW
jgi:hypothetical protein